MDSILNYFSGLDIFGWVEILAMVVGIYYVYLEIRKARLLWYVCILASVLNIFVFQHNRYLSMTIIQFYYIATALYGIWAFRKIDRDAAAEYGAAAESDGRKVTVRRFSWKVGGITLAIAAAVYFVLVPVLQHYAEAHGTALFPSQPYWDAFIAVGSMVGTFFLSKSYMCQWYVWIVLNVISVGVFIYSGMYWMAGMYTVYIVMAVIGLRNWRNNGIYVE